MRENTDQKNSTNGHFSHSGSLMRYRYLKQANGTKVLK